MQNQTENKSILMECKINQVSPIRKELTISVKPEAIENYKEKQYAKLQKKAKIKGFRPGKVPLSLVKKYFAQDVLSDVFSQVIQDGYLQAIIEHKIQPVGNPQFEPKSGHDLSEGTPLTFVAKVEVLPDFKVSDLSKLKVSKPNDQVKKEDIEKNIENLRKAHAEIAPNEGYEGPVKDGDLVELSFKGTIDGKEDPSLVGNNRFLRLGAGQYIDGFETNLLGMKKGETKSFTLTFPKDYSTAEYAGKKAEFEVTIHEFKKETLPEMDDEFAKQFKAETFKELRTKIEEDLKRTAERNSKSKLRERMIDQLIEMNQFEIPSHFTNMQIDHLVKENAKTLMQQGFTDKMVKEFLDKNKEELKARAEKQVRASLLLDKIAQDAQIKIEDADLDHEFDRIAKEETLDIGEVRKYFESDTARNELKFRLREERTFDILSEKAKITEEK